MWQCFSEGPLCVRAYPPLDRVILRRVGAKWHLGVVLCVQRELLLDELDQKYKYREHTHPEALRIRAEIKTISQAIRSMDALPDEKTVERALQHYCAAAAHLKEWRPAGWMHYAGLL